MLKYDHQLNRFAPIAKSIEMLLYPHAEVVIHDLEKKTIHAIFNPMSDRKPGDDSMIDMKSLQGSGDFFAPYIKTNPDGQTVKSTTAVLRGPGGRGIGLLCINLDIAKIAAFRDVLDNFLQADLGEERPEALFKDDWQDQINEYVKQFLVRKEKTRDTMDRHDRRELVIELFKTGALSGRYASAYTAKILGVSRGTIYNYLKKGN